MSKFKKKPDKLMKKTSQMNKFTEPIKMDLNKIPND